MRARGEDAAAVSNAGRAAGEGHAVGVCRRKGGGGRCALEIVGPGGVSATVVARAQARRLWAGDAGGGARARHGMQRAAGRGCWWAGACGGPGEAHGGGVECDWGREGGRKGGGVRGRRGPLSELRRRRRRSEVAALLTSAHSVSCSHFLSPKHPAPGAAHSAAYPNMSTTTRPSHPPAGLAVGLPPRSKDGGAAFARAPISLVARAAPAVAAPPAPAAPAPGHHSHSLNEAAADAAEDGNLPPSPAHLRARARAMHAPPPPSPQAVERLRTALSSAVAKAERAAVDAASARAAAAAAESDRDALVDYVVALKAAHASEEARAKDALASARLKLKAARGAGGGAVATWRGRLARRCGRGEDGAGRRPGRGGRCTGTSSPGTGCHR